MRENQDWEGSFRTYEIRIGKRGMERRHERELGLRQDQEPRTVELT
jgi:hypothetical protein